ncbi:hypothetical protein Tco_0794121, partial [Tanacetum coccineum]
VMFLPMTLTSGNVLTYDCDGLRDLDRGLSWMIQISLWKNTSDSKKKKLEAKVEHLISKLAAFSCEPTVSPLDNNKIDFNILFDESDDEDYMIVFDKNLFSCKIISVDNLKTDSENGNDKINIPSSPSPEPTIGYFDDLDFFKGFENEFPAIVYNDLKSKSYPLNEPSVSSQNIDKFETSLSEYDENEQNTLCLNIAPLPYRDVRHPWLRYQVDGYDKSVVYSYEQRLKTIWGRLFNRVHVLDFVGLTDGMRQTLGDRLSMVYTGDDGEALFTSWRRLFELGGARRRMIWRQFILALGLHSEEDMAKPGFGAYWSGKERVIPNKGDLRDYWIKISSDRDFLGTAPSYIHIRDPVRRLCYRMIACSISGRGQGAEKVTGVDLFYLRTMDRGTANVLYLLAQYLFHHAKGRKSGARFSRGHFIGRLAAHFGLVGDQGLRGLLVVMSELPVINVHELDRLNICARFGDTWAWVAPGVKRQQAAMASAPGAAEGAPVADEGTQAVPAPLQAPYSPPPAPQPRTMSQIDRLKEEAFDSALVGSSRLSYKRHVRPRIGDANTSAAP